MYVRKFALRNCQSMADVSVKLSPGLNVIIAPNSTGKSVFMKMLRHACGASAYKSKHYKHCIRYGSDCAVALFELSDGSVGGVKLTGNNRVFLYKSEDDTALSVYNEPHPSFLKKMGIVMDTKTKFVLNLIDPDQELIFVNSNPTTNYTLVKLIGHNDTLEQLVVNHSCASEDISTYLKIAREQNAQIKRKLDTFTKIDLNTTKSKLEIGYGLLPLCKRYTDMYEMLSCIKPLDALDIDTIESIAEALFWFGNLLDNLRKIEKVPDLDFDRMDAAVEYFHKLEAVEENLTALIHGESKLRSIESELQEVVEILQKNVQIVECPIKGKVFYFEDEVCLACGD